MYGSMRQSTIADQATDKLVDGIVGAMRNPSALTPASIRQMLNDGLHQHTFNHSTSSNIYIPSLKEGEEPWARLSNVLRGRIDGFTKPNNPWEEWTRDPKVVVRDLTVKLAESPQMMAPYFGLAEKALAGAPMSDQETFLLRIGNAVTFRIGQPIAGKEFTQDKMQYTKEEKEKTVTGLRICIEQSLIDNLPDHPAIAKTLGVDLKKYADDMNYAEEVMLKLGKEIPTPVVMAYIKDMKNEANQRIDLTRQADLAHTQAMTDAMTDAMAYSP
jgi:hypothetical protein